MFRWTINLTLGTYSQRPLRTDVVVQNEVYSFGGIDNNSDSGDDIYQIKVSVFNTVSLCWAKLPLETKGGEGPLDVPSMRKREGYTAVLIGGAVYTWGRCPDHNMLYALDVDDHRWFKPKISGTFPKSRYNHSACALGEAMYVHGGCAQAGYTNDMHKLDTATMAWALIGTGGTPAPASYAHSATIIGTKMFVFGGLAVRSGECYNIVSVFDTETNLWLNTPEVGRNGFFRSKQVLPKERYDHSAFAYNGELYIIGGSKKYFTVLWKFSPESFSWRQVKPREEGRSSRMNCDGMCCCTVGDRIFFFGGCSTPNDLHVLDLSPSLKTLCKLAVLQHDLDQSGLPHNTRWELAAHTPCTDRLQPQPIGFGESCPWL